MARGDKKSKEKSAELGRRRREPEDNGELTELPDLGPARHFEQIVHETFNYNPVTRNNQMREWVPATVFVASDHLMKVIVRNQYLREGKKGDMDPSERFARAVWEIHSTIFLNYHNRWSKHVGVAARSKALTDICLKGSFKDDAVVSGLLHELALWMLIYTEGANLRHCPEALWFYYWLCMTSSHFEEAVRQGMPEIEDDFNIREYRVHWRNANQAIIEQMQNAVHGCSGMLLEQIPQRELQGKMNEAGSIVHRELRNAGHNANRAVLRIATDLVCMGDGGHFTNTVLQPVFDVFSYEIHYLGVINAVENSHRLGYDDVNESLTRKDVVYKFLKQTNSGLDKLIEKGGNYHEFDHLKVMKWYREKIFAKTFIERRSVLAIFRAFFRNYSFHILAVHLQFAIAFGDTYDNEDPDNTLKQIPWSSHAAGVAVTHAFLQAFERTANAFLTRQKKNPFQQRAKDEEWMFKNDYGKKKKKKTKDGDVEGVTPRKQQNPIQVQKSTDERPTVHIEGAPIAGGWLGGSLEYWFLAIGMLVAYLLGSAQVGEMKTLIDFWPYIGGGYMGLVIFHEVVTTRDGYQVSLSSMMRLPMGPWTAKATPESYLYEPMRTGWKTFFWNMFYWILVFAIKFPFDYFLIIKPLVRPLEALRTREWLSTCPASVIRAEPGVDHFWKKDTKSELFGVELGIRCIDADYVLLVARIIPFFLVTIVDTAVAHQLVMAVFGYFLGIWRLNLGLVSTWEDVIKEFHRAPALWWDRAMSKEGRRNQEIWTQLNYSADVEKQKKSKKSKGDKEHTMFKELFDPTNRARWNAFGSAWDSIVDDLREADIISNEEQTNLKFVYLGGTKGSMRPILLPSFFYAGQIQNVIDTGIVSDGQRVVLQEFKALCAELLAWIGILTQEQADEVKKVELLTATIDQAHRLSRRQLFSSAKGLVKAMTAITTLNETSDASRRREAYRLVMQNMKEVVQEVKVECRAVNKAAEKKKAKVTRGAVEASRKLMDVLKNTEAQFISSDGHVPGELAAALQQLERGGADMSAISMASEADLQVPSAVVHKVLGVIKDMLVKTRKEASPDANEAKRILSFFMSSLNNPELPQPTTLADMLSHTVLTPVYQEDILYPFDGQEACQKIFGMQATPDLVDLMTETEDKVSLMSYLRSVFPKDWENFKERLGDRINTKCDRVTEYDFRTGAPLDRWQLELQLWASNRGQLLARTIRGMMMFDKAIRTLASLEHPRPLNMAESTWNKRIDELADAKFSYVCSCQTYGKNRVDKKASRHRWLAEAVETLMQVYPRLNVAFLDFNETERGRTNYSVMACGKPLREGFESENVLDRADRYLEVYRVRLPVHTYSDSGAIVGEGKPENQNHAVIFAHGEALQAIDMNQDNHLAEAVKQRNLLSELRVDLEIEHKKRFEDLQKKFPSSAKDAHKKMLALKTSVQPVALVGHREWIFSDKSGALGSFAASAEFAFGTIVQRITWWPGSSRMHYGHPDVFYKIYSMTRGGMSKATKTLHISEDVFGGLNHTLRGAKFKYREYIQVGKGRDMGFDAINAFEIKISGGNGEVCISRDIHRLGTRMDFFRMMAFYHSGTGYFINILLLMWSVLAQLWAITFFAMAEAGTLARPTDCPEGKTQPECDDLRDAQCGEFNLRDEAGERLVGQDCFDRLAELAAQADSLEERLNFGLYELDNTMKAENLIQIGTLSIMPYVAELLLEYGFFSTLGTLLYQFVGGSFAFFVFKQQTTTAFFWDDIIYGGALYIGTGRGFSYKAESFIKVFTNYSRSHLYFAAELFVLLIVLRAAASSAEYGNYGATTWGIWLVCVSLLISPFWFNPMMFSTSKIIRDFKAFKAWILRGELDPGTGSTWFSWNEKKLTKHRNERRNQTDHWLNIMRDGWFGALPAALMALAAVSRMNIEISQLPDALNSKYIVFLLASGFLWAFLLVVMKMRGSYKSQALTRSWRLMKTGLMVMVIVVLAFYVAVIINLSSTKSAGEIFLVLYANYNIVLIVHRIMLYHSIDDPSYRSIVDAGYRFVDIIIGFTMLSVLFVLSLGGLVSRIQAFLLFNVSFAKSVRRGKLVRTIGQSKEEPGLDEDQSRYLMGNRRRQAVAGSSNTAMRA